MQFTQNFLFGKKRNNKILTKISIKLCNLKKQKFYFIFYYILNYIFFKYYFYILYL